MYDVAFKMALRTIEKLTAAREAELEADTCRQETIRKVDFKKFPWIIKERIIVRAN